MNDSRLHIYLQRMEIAARRASEYAADLDQARFLQARKTQDAVLANIAAIGECVVKIMDNYPTFAIEHSSIPWHDIRAVRNRIAHQYFDVDVGTIWLTVTVAIPDLLDRLQALRHWRPQGE